MPHARRPSFLNSAFASMAVVALAAAPVLVGCGDSVTCDDCGDPTTGGTTTGGTTTGGTTTGGTTTGGTTTGGTTTGGNDLTWTTLITGYWELGPGSESTNDLHTTIVDHDVYVAAIRPIAPLGTHHTALGIGSLGAGNIIYASGVGTNPLIFPKGVGFKIPAQQSVVLQLHIFNTSGEKLTGTSGIEVVEVDPSEIKEEAELFLPGPVNFNIPPNQKYTASGTCTAKAPQTLFAIFPHMHQLGTHVKTTATIGGVPTVIHDGDYSFYNQEFLEIDPVSLNAGDTITTDCTWDNSTPQSVTWGESSTAEMCFSIMYRYPAVGADSGFGFCSK